MSRRLYNSGLIIFALVLSLNFLGRSFFCECGEFHLWVGDANSSHTSQHFLDPYTFSHFQHGLIFFALFYVLNRPKIEYGILLESIWEFAENTPYIINRYRTATISLGYTGDSIWNSLSDVLVCGLGFYFASRVNWKIALATLFLIEIFMLVVYKDSLSINVIMLMYPIASIREWQQG